MQYSYHYPFKKILFKMINTDHLMHNGNYGKIVYKLTEIKKGFSIHQSLSISYFQIRLSENLCTSKVKA